MEDQKIMYYMNQPCNIIREITNEFVEVELYPKFNDDINGGMWCTECMVGNHGTPTRHVCEEYQSVIDALNDVENRIFVIVEKRLLAKDPIEFKPILSLVKEIDSLKEKKNLSVNEISFLQNTINEQKENISIIEKDIESKKLILNSIKNEIDVFAKKVDKLQKEYIFQITNSDSKIVDVTEEYKYLQQRDSILCALEVGGVDNWEWYSESISKISDEV